MKFNNIRNEKNYNRVKRMALEKGFSEEDLKTHYLDRLSKKTSSSRIQKFINLAYYLGWLRGIKYVDEGQTPINLEHISNIDSPNLIAKLLNLEKEYSSKQKELNDMESKIKKEANNLSIEDLQKYSYEELIYIKNKIFPYLDIFFTLEIEKLINKKMIEKNPALGKAHYYCELNKIDFLTKEEILNLDNLLKNKSSNIKPCVRNFLEVFIDRTDKETKQLSKEIIKFLLSEKIIEKEYVLGCNCEEDIDYKFKCFKEYIPKSKLDKHERAWEINKKYLDGTITKEDEKELSLLCEKGYGYIYISCNKESIQIENKEEFNKHIKNVNFLIIKKPK